MYKIFGHYIPKALFLLGTTELTILFFSVFVATISITASLPPYDGTIVINTVLFSSVIFISMVFMGLYRRDLREKPIAVTERVLLSFCVGLLLLVGIYYVYPDYFFGQNVFLISATGAFTGVLISRLVFFNRTDEYLKRRVLVIGTGFKAQQLESMRRRTDNFGVEILGYISIPNCSSNMIPDSKIVNKTDDFCFSQLYQYVEQHKVNELIVALDDRRNQFPVDDMLECKMQGIHIIDINIFLERQQGKISLETLNPSAVIYSDGFTRNHFKTCIKFFSDNLISLIMLIFATPIMLLTALAILIESGGRDPIFYRQKRVGKNNQTFNVLKFRSMHLDAEKDGVAKWASKNDSRVTKVGAFIRKTRIDELPQLFNVLAGDMSFVGPRPERPKFVEDLAEEIAYYRLRHHIKPGITGWAQINYPYGASVADAKEKLQFDLYYLKHHNLFLDLIIVMQTVAVIVRSMGSR
ncbi:MAG: TIGR03013 family PEP-CTERM/XrtA system glycosyltransferase [Ignavibacteria bacterium]|nr:TIGR03013 family PEP-CTERM/XrtA system glycosyltransferase [Ignavibacteria bacterium]